MLNFEWNSKKSASKLKKHGVSFEEATTVFADPLSSTISDPLHSDDENRFITIGRSHLERIIIVVHVDRGDNNWRSSGMQKAKIKRKKPEMLDEYDFSCGIRGKYVSRYRHGTNVVVLDPDVARVFPTSKSVNKALRELARKNGK